MRPSLFDTINIYVAAVSIVLAVLALWLSIVFYRWGDRSARDAAQAFKDIKETVNKLEFITTHFYNDVFSIFKGMTSEHTALLRESFQALQKKGADTDLEVQRKLLEMQNKRVDEAKSAIVKEATANLGEIPEAQTFAVRAQLASTVAKAMDSYRQIENETQQEVLRKAILNMVAQQETSVIARDLISTLADSFPRNRVIQELERLGGENALVIDPLPLKPTSTLQRRS